MKILAKHDHCKGIFIQVQKPIGFPYLRFLACFDIEVHNCESFLFTSQSYQYFLDFKLAGH